MSKFTIVNLVFELRIVSLVFPKHGLGIGLLCPLTICIIMKKFTAFALGYLLTLACVFAQENPFYDNARFDVDESLAPFYHGVASGDPTSTSVMIWTRVSTDSLQAHVEWQVATDTSMTDIVASGTTVTDGESDFTVKVDVTGLSPYTTYYYEFRSHGNFSLRGRTKTAPDGDVDALRFGVVSCSNFAHGYFHVYDKLVDRNDIDAIIHLGDYLYEYGNGEYGDVRELEPTNEIITLSDYRMRHSYYKLDEKLRRLHQQYAIIATWDDHESANDAWFGGAENHESDEGDWFERKSNAIQSYHEWMPFRTPDVTDQERIYRKLEYGNMMDLFMLDTRLVGREEQDGANNTDADRTLLGQNQKDWLKNGLQGSTAKWQVVGQQVMMAPLEIFGSGLNADQWDGYRAERDELWNWVINENVPNMVVLTGDIHTSWANDLPMSGYDEDTGANSAGVEFVVTSVTSPGLDFLPGAENLVLPFNDHMKWANLNNRGYYILDLNETRAQADWYFVGSVTDESTSDSHANSWYTNDGSRHLQGANGPATPNPNIFTAYAPDAPRPFDPVSTHDLNELAFIGLHPNPATDQIYLQFFNHDNLNLTLSIYDVAGRKVMGEDLGLRAAGLQKKTIDIDELNEGIYFVILQTEKGSYRKTMVKTP